MTTTVTHDEATRVIETLVESIDVPCEVDVLPLRAYIEQQHSAAASTQVLREAAERLCAAVEGFDPERDGTWQRMHDACADLRSALAADGGGQ